jgi:hypothetical protein
MFWGGWDELGQPDLRGRIRRATAEGFDLATRDGPRSVELDVDTRFLDERGAKVSAADPHAGELVAVYGELNTVESSVFIARAVVRLPPRAIATP